MPSNAELALIFSAKNEQAPAAGRVRADLAAIEGKADSTSRAFARLGDSGRHLARLDGAVHGLLGTAARLGGALFAVQAAGAAIGGSADSIGSLVRGASDTEEAMSKVRVVFGASADSIKAFAETADTSLGLSRMAALSATGTFGNLFTAMGIGQAPAAELSTSLVALASDLASFNNISTGEALEKLRAGLVGEAEPLRALGVNLTAATIEAKALELGLVATGAELSAAAKAQAAYALIFEQTKNAQGDFARTSDGLANQLRILDASFTTLKSSAGEALLPLATEGVKALNTFLTETRRLQGEGLNVVDAGLTSIAARIREGFGDDAARGFERATSIVGNFASGFGTSLKKISEGDFQGVWDDLSRDAETGASGLGKIFSGWVGPAWEQTKERLDEMADALGDFIVEQGPGFEDKVANEWAPAFRAWVLDKAAPAILEDMATLAGRLLSWTTGEGRTVIYNAGLAMGQIWREGVRDSVLAAFALLTELDNRSREVASNLARGLLQPIVATGGPVPGEGTSSAPRTLGGGMAGPTPDEINQSRRAEALANGEASYARFVAAREQAAADEIAAANAATAAEAAWQKQVADANWAYWEAQRKAAAASSGTTGAVGAGGGAAPRELERSRTAIEGFMAELGRDAPRWERAFGEIGSRVALALGEAIESGTDSSGAAVARSLQDLIREAERSGVPSFQALGDDLAGSLHDALVDRGNPMLRSAALENLRAYTETIRSANALSPESFSRALGLESARAALGSGGQSVMEALGNAIKEGGAQAIASLAQSVAAMRRTLFEDRDISPERAREVWSRIFAAVNTAIADGSAEARTNLESFFRDLNFEQLTLKVGDQLAERLKAAGKDLADAVKNATKQAREQLASARDSLAESRALRTVRDDFTDRQKQDLEDINRLVEIQRQAYHDLNEERDVGRRREREDADLARSRAQEDIDLARRAREGAGRAFTPVQTPEQITEIMAGRARGPSPLDDPGYQAGRAQRELELTRARQDTERQRVRVEQNADLLQSRADREKDFQTEQGFAARIDVVRRNLATQLRVFEDGLADQALLNQENRVGKEYAASVIALVARYDEQAREANQWHTGEMERINLQRDSWDTVMDGYLADLEEAARRMGKLQEPGKLGGQSLGTEPLPVPFGPAWPGVPRGAAGEDSPGGVTIAPVYNQNAPIFGVDGLEAVFDLFRSKIIADVNSYGLVSG